ncbi:MAG: hypothetical protein AUK25_10835 [Desulfobacteraceae bacterium CG2_30_51_40]|nr:MAG: hypothetical protein AUK25_10835 [Desulfobacteraceae bacterium CG2_30_51_40]
MVSVYEFIPQGAFFALNCLKPYYDIPGLKLDRQAGLSLGGLLHLWQRYPVPGPGKLYQALLLKLE